jgi:predicted nucleotidyltransferase
MEEQRANILNDVIQRITTTLHPEKIYLFGSHAWGTATSDSDIDLFII